MGYACPVCDSLQSDEEHLANHLAVTATVHGEAHASWLDSHVPDWPSLGPDELAPQVIDYADSVDQSPPVEDVADQAGARSTTLDGNESVEEAIDRARELLDEDSDG